MSFIDNLKDFLKSFATTLAIIAAIVGFACLSFPWAYKFFTQVVFPYWRWVQQ